MELNHSPYRIFADKARELTVEVLSLGLGYTAVKTSDDGIGVSYTYLSDKRTCMALNTQIEKLRGHCLRIEEMKSCSKNCL